MEDEHTISTEALQDGETAAQCTWKVECSCGWTEYCSDAEEIQEAIYEHRRELLGNPL